MKTGTVGALANSKVLCKWKQQGVVQMEARRFDVNANSKVWCKYKQQGLV